MVSANDRIASAAAYRPVAYLGVSLYDGWPLSNTHPGRNTPTFLGDTPLLVTLLVTDTQTSDKLLITGLLMPIDIAINGFMANDFVACFQSHDPTNLFGGKLLPKALEYRFFKCPLKLIGFSFSRCFAELLSGGCLIGLVGILLTIAG